MFLECVRPPLLTQVSAVVGCRALTDSGKKEMKALFERTGSEAFRVSEQCNFEYDKWVSRAISNVNESLKECPPELPAGIPTPPPLEDGQKFPWLFVHNTGWVRRKEPIGNEEMMKKWKEKQAQWLKEDTEADMELEEKEEKEELTDIDACK